MRLARLRVKRSFFEEVGSTMRDNTMLVIGKRDGRRLCAALDIYTPDTLWGRYWGMTEYVPGLHFEACYYQAIEFCIERAIPLFEGGAQGEHKMARGLMPTPTASSHWLAHPAFADAVGDFLAREGQAIQGYVSELAEHRPFKSPA